MATRAQLWGKRFGELTAIKAVGKNRYGIIWLCRCDCGRAALRTAASLRYAMRLGNKPCCRECLAELRGGIYFDGLGQRRMMWLNRWIDHGTLYSWNDDENMAAAIRDDIAELLGFRPEDESQMPPVACLWEPPRGPTEPDGMTLEEIGQEIGVSRERVRQIILTALKKLRQALTVQRVAEEPEAVDLEAARERYRKQEREKAATERTRRIQASWWRAS